MPPEDRPPAFARFQMENATTKRPAADGGAIEFCPCQTCRATVERRIRKGSA